MVSANEVRKNVTKSGSSTFENGVQVPTVARIKQLAASSWPRADSSLQGGIWDGHGHGIAIEMGMRMV